MTQIAAFVIFFVVVAPAFILMALQVFRMRTRGAAIWGAVTVLGAVCGLALEAAAQM